MKLVMALWVNPDVVNYNENVSYVDYSKVDFGKLHSLITNLFGFGQYPKLSVTNQVIDALDWDTALVFGESYCLSYLEDYETQALRMDERQYIQKIVDLGSSDELLHLHHYERNKAPAPLCIPIIVKDGNLTNLREWLIYCREKIHVRDQNLMFHPEINPKKENGLFRLRSKGLLKDRDLNELFHIFGIRFKSEVMFSFMSKKSMNHVLGIKNSRLKLVKKI